MSNLHRIQELLAYLEEEPNNPFNLYALALEYQNIDPERAVDYFNELLTSHGDYLPTYYHAADFFARRNEIDKAKAIYEEGIRLATQVKNSHALRELENAFLNFQFENE